LTIGGEQIGLKHEINQMLKDHIYYNRIGDLVLEYGFLNHIRGNAKGLSAFAGMM
jgi:hypothetical protein